MEHMIHILNLKENIFASLYKELEIPGSWYITKVILIVDKKY